VAGDLLDRPRALLKQREDPAPEGIGQRPEALVDHIRN
jgi:hypothetical protein